MPYPGEFASKAVHAEIVRNPDVTAFLQECDYLKPPSDEECQAVAAHFVPPPTSPTAIPSIVIATDGSHHESSLDDNSPAPRSPTSRSAPC